MLIEALKASLSAPRNDGMLHFSQHLQHDRHAVLYMTHGYPSVVPSWGRLFPLVQGTGVHETVHAHMPSIVDSYTAEYPLNVTDGFKYPWTGTVDAFARYDNANWILDYKTISGAGMFFLGEEPKEDHVWQVSAYAAFAPKTRDWRTAVLYLPSSPDYKRNWEEPVLLEFDPLPATSIISRMREVEAAIDLYKETGALPDWPEPSYVWKKRGQTWHLEERPHYTSMFCPWNSLHDDPCKCGDQTLLVIAKYKNGTLKVEDGYDIIVEKIGEPDEDQ